MEFGGVKLFQNLRGTGSRHVFNVVGHWMSEKYDGVRALYLGNKQLVTCRGLKIEAPDSFFEGWPEGYVFDGELWMGKNNFETMSGLARRSASESPLWDSVQYLVFDIIRVREKESPSETLDEKLGKKLDMIRMPFESRQEILQKILPPFELDLPSSLKLNTFQPIPQASPCEGAPSQASPCEAAPSQAAPSTALEESVGKSESQDCVDGYGDLYSDEESESGESEPKSEPRTLVRPQHIYWIKQYLVSDLETFQLFYQSLVKGGSEGVVIIPKGELYRPGVRSNYKLKEVDEIEGVVVDYKLGSGRNAGLIGSFQVQMVTSDGTVLPKKTFSIGTGLTQYQRQHGKELYPVGTVLTCHYNGLTSTGIPRFPRLKGVRPDFVLKNFQPIGQSVPSILSQSKTSVLAKKDVTIRGTAQTIGTLDQAIIN